MINANSPTTLAHSFWPVKSDSSSWLTLPVDSMIHHKVSLSKNKKMIVSYSGYRGKPYGVSKAQRVLSPQLLLKKFDYIRDCLDNVLKLTTAQREVTIRLLRLWAYYGNVYPKEAQVTSAPGCSKATYWRTLRSLKELGLIVVVNRYVIRPHAQISNLYRLDKLVILLARYLAEHIAHVWPDWLWPYLHKPWPEFWNILRGGQLKLILLFDDAQTAPD